MDMQAIIPTAVKASASNTSAVSAKSSSGQGAVSTSKSDSGTFANLLQAEVTPTSTEEQAAVINSELLAAMSAMPQSLQLMLNGLESNAEGDQSLVASILESMNRNPELAQTLLNDADVQQWLQEAMALLNAWASSQTSGMESAMFNQHGLGMQSLTDGDQANVLEMQRVLMAISSLNEKQPDHPILQHLVTQLKQVMEPYSASLTSQVDANSSGTEMLAQTVAASTGKNVQQDRNTSMINGAVVKGQVNTEDTVSSDTAPNKITVQSALSKLELLAAKSSHPYVNQASSNQLQPLAQESLPSDLTANMELSAQQLTALKNPQMLQDGSKVLVPTMNAANFAEDMSQFVVKTMKVSLLGEGLSEAKITLQPQNLGHIDVKLSMHNGTLIAQIGTHTLGAKELLESQLPQLRVMLQNQGLQVERLEVTQNSSASSMMFQDHGQRQQSFNQNNSSNSRTSSDSLGIEEMELMQEIKEAKEMIRNVGNENSSFHARA